MSDPPESTPKTAPPSTPPPPRGLSLSLKVKLSLLITALVVLAVTLVSAFLIRQEQQTLTAEMTKRGLTIAENLSAGAKTSLIASDELTLNVLVKDAMKDPDVAYVAIVDENRTVLAHSDVGEIGKPIARPPGLESVPGRSYFALASFSDPDGNGWLLQEVTTRLPGREWED